ncbi:MAG TPA: ribonuclease HI family protein [bacterium]|nr:ribonuclease HI family protein [bacterium]
MAMVVYIDGASRGNPGKSGAGIVLLNVSSPVGKNAAVPIISLREYLGIATNNEAEYMALIIALRYLKSAVNTDGKLPLEIAFFSDSQLLVRQMNGAYSVKSTNILPLYKKSKKLLEDIKADSAKFTHIPRELNKEADKLANLAIDEATHK